MSQENEKDLSSIRIVSILSTDIVLRDMLSEGWDVSCNMYLDFCPKK